MSELASGEGTVAECREAGVRAVYGGALVALLLAAFAGTGLFVAQRQLSTVREAAAAELHSVAELKAGQLTQWMRERRGDALLVRSNPLVLRLLDEPRERAAREDAAAYFQELLTAYGYEAAALFDARGELLLASCTNELSAFGCLAKHVEAAARGREVVVTDLHRSEEGGPVHFSLLCPVRDAPAPPGTACGVVALVVNPRKFLFPFIERWPIPSRSGETLLLRRAGGEVEYLNGGRGRSERSLAVRQPLSRTEVPAVRAALGEAGPLSGVNERGVAVIAEACTVAGTPWVLLAALDTSEVDAPFRRDAWRIAVVVALASLAVLLGIGLLWRQQRLLDVQRELAVRRRAELKLRQSEERYRGIFAESVATIYVFDQQKRFVDSNQAGLDLLGYTRGELLKLSIPDVDADPVVVLPAHQELLSGGRLVNYEHRLRRKDGRVVTVLNNSRALTDGEGRVLGMLSTLLDITERKRGEDRLRKLSDLQADLHNPGTLEQKLKLVTDAVLEMLGADFVRIWLVRAGDRCESGCAHAAAAAGRGACPRRDRCLHLVASSGRYTHLDGAVHRRVPIGCYKIGRVASGEEPSSLTNDVVNDPRVHDPEWARRLGLVSFAGYRLSVPRGETFGVLALFSTHALASDEDALLHNLCSLIVPVILGAHAEAALEQSRALLRLVLDTVPQAVFWKDSESRYLGCNRAFARLAGFEEPERLAGKTDYELPWLREESDAYRADDRLVVSTAQARRHIIESQRRADGALTWVDTSKVPLQDASGRPFGVLGVYDDITARKQMEEDLRARNEELVRFAYTVSHDLKSPLVTIRTFLGYLETDLAKGDEARVQADLGYIGRAADKMLNLLDELLELSRVGRKMNPPEDLPFAELVRAALDTVAGQVAARGVRVCVNEAPLLLRGDRTRLAEVFQNLLDNAVKFMGEQPDPQVEVGAEGAGDEVVFYVRDNGLGIDPRHSGKLFGLFEKLHTGTPGSGMGLALVKRIVEVHGGRIWADSAGPGLGATFRFTLQGTRRVS